MKWADTASLPLIATANAIWLPNLVENDFHFLANVFLHGRMVYLRQGLMVSLPKTTRSAGCFIAPVLRGAVFNSSFLLGLSSHLDQAVLSSTLVFVSRVSALVKQQLENPVQFRSPHLAGLLQRGPTTGCRTATRKYVVDRSVYRLIKHLGIGVFSRELLPS
jgi:hypothetical protein